MANTIDFYVDQGSDFHRTITIKDSSGTPIDITERSYSATAKDDFRTPKITINFNLLKGNQTTHTGMIDLHIPAEATRALKISETKALFYDVKESYSGNERTLFSGQIFIEPRATL